MSKEMLISANDIVPLDIFLNGKHCDILDIIKTKAKLENLDVEKPKDRKLMISTASKIASSKTFLEKIGKTLADNKRAEIDQELSTINSVRNEIKTTLDELKTEVRKPVTDWEIRKAEIEEEKQRIIDYDLDHVTALAENVLFDERREMAAENERLRKAEEKRQVKETARIEAEENVEEERLAGLRRELEAKEKLEQAKIDKQIAEQKAIDNAKQAEIDKQYVIDTAEQNRIAAEKKVEINKYIEAEKVKDKAGYARISILSKLGINLDFSTLRDMQEKEWDEFFELKNKEYQSKQNDLHIKKLKEEREAEETRINQERIERENNQIHRKKIGRGVLNSLIENGIGEDCAKSVIILVAKGKIKNMKIEY